MAVMRKMQHPPCENLFFKVRAGAGAAGKAKNKHKKTLKQYIKKDAQTTCIFIIVLVLPGPTAKKHPK